MSDSSSSKVDNECQRERCLRLEMLLKGSKVQNSMLKEENKKLKEKVEKMEEEVRNKDGVMRDLTEIKGGVRKLYGVAKSVLGTMTGNGATHDGSYFKVINIKSIDKLCDDLQEKLVDWQGAHQLLHDKLKEVLNVTEEFADELINESNEQALSEAPGPSTRAPATTSNSSTTTTHRWNSGPLLKPGILRQNPVPPQQQQARSTQLTCDTFNNKYCRLDHVCSKLASKPQPGVGLSEASPAIEKVQVKQSSEIGKTGSGSSTGNTRPSPKLPETTAAKRIRQDHGFATVSRTSLKSPDGGAPIIERRLFCKCGSNYLYWPTFSHHLMTMGERNNFECGLCRKNFRRTILLKIHLKMTHGHKFV